MRRILCWMNLHEWRLFKAYRMTVSVVHQVRCQNCSQLLGQAPAYVRRAR